MGVGWRWRILSSRDKRAHLVWRWGGENFLTRNLIVSHEPRLAKKDHTVHSYIGGEESGEKEEIEVR